MTQFLLGYTHRLEAILCYTCLDQSFPSDIAGLAQNNTSDRQETVHRLYSIIKHQHTII
jgi:hypothetical protein